MTIFDYLPECYHKEPSKEIVHVLTDHFQEHIINTFSLLDKYSETYLNPYTCLPEWLDILAYYSGWGKLWKSSWLISQKRLLLAKSNEIWENRGNLSGLEILFDIFSLDVSVKANSGFIVGVSLLPSNLNADPFDLIVTAPYQNGTTERNTLEHILKYFIPCWVRLEIITN